MSISLNDNIKINAGKPVESKYLNSGNTSYNDVNEVNAMIPIGERYIGLTVNINTDEFWYATGLTNSDLVLKFTATGTTINSVQNIGSGIGVYSGLTETGVINLRSILGSGNTTVSLSGDTIIVNSVDSTSLQNGLLMFSESGQTYVPYDSFNTGVTFYYGDTLPTGTTRLNLNARLNVTELSLSTDHTASGVTHMPGDIYWDPEDSTISLYQTSGVTQQIGQELFVKAKNTTGGLISNGEVVYVNGSIGNRPTIGLARANEIDGDIVSEVIGMVTEDIPAGEDGFVTTFGLVRDINTSGYTEGDILYLSPLVYGGITNIKPDYPDYTVEVGIVVSTGETDGSIYIRVNDITTPQSIRGVENANTTSFTADTRSDFIASYANNDIYLPPSPLLGQQITVVDAVGDADVNNITIYGNGKQISGVDLMTLENEAIVNTNWGSLTMVYNGTFWSIVATS